MKNNILLKTNLLVSVILLVGFALIATLSYRANYNASLVKIKQVSSLASEGIYYRLSTMLTKPVNISQTIAHDSLLIKLLEEEGSRYQEAGYQETIRKYLDTYKNKYAYDSVFLVSASTNNYYNFNGLDRNLARGEDENVWYYNFLQSGEEYSLNIDNDEVAGAANKITLFDKDKMATFERYFLEDKEIQKEKKGYYYTLRNREDICDQILDEFGALGPHSHIINGHVPVKTIQGEQPMKANGKLFVIDGGFSKAYQPETGIAGYTLVYHSHGMQLVQHEPFQSRQKAIEEGLDIKSTNFVLEFNSQRMMVKDTDKGKELVTQIQDLKKLLVAYRIGLIKEKV